MAVYGSGKGNARNGANGCRLSRTAPLSLIAWRRRRIPDALPVVEAEGERAAADFRIRINRLTVRDWNSANIGEGDVHIRFVGSRTPLNAAINSALSDSNLPQYFAVSVWI